MDIPSDRVSTGRNPDLGSWRDDRYVRCAKCGFILNRDRHVRGTEGSRMGYGIDLSSTTFNTIAGHYMSTGGGWGSGTWTNTTSSGLPWSPTTATVRIDPIVNAACPLCGTYLY